MVATVEQKIADPKDLMHSLDNSDSEALAWLQAAAKSFCKKSSCSVYNISRLFAFPRYG